MPWVERFTPGTAEEVIYVLHTVARITFVSSFPTGYHRQSLRASAGRNYDDEPIRRVNSVNLILPAPEGLAIQVLAARQYTENGFEYPAEKVLQQALAAAGLIGKNRVNAEIETRERFLRHLRKKGTYFS